MSARPAQEWWTAAEIAEAGLADLPSTKRRVNALADRACWAADAKRARRRAGKGGGWEYHWTLFPARAQRQLLAAAAHAPAAEPRPRDEAWAAFEVLPEKPKAEARRRLGILAQVGAMAAGGESKSSAIAQAARLAGVSPRSVWDWFGLVEGVRSDDWLPYLAPRHRDAKRTPRKAQCSPDFWNWIRSDFLRSAGPSFSTCYRRALRIAREQGWDILPERTMRRRLEAEVSQATIVLARKGAEALRRRYPSQVRDKTALHAMEAVNADFHKFDLFVRFPAEGGENAPVVARPQMVAFQDIYSGRILAWRVDRTPNALAVQLAAGDLVETWGIPGHVLLDNGREFAAKAITGGAPTRYRFKVREDDLPGLFVALGCEIHWATPYSGQSKPIERAFRDMCDAIAKDPRFDGAWTGNRPDAKPEDYGSRAIGLDEFLKVLAEGIEEHNTRQGRRSEVAWGRSFAEVFDESYGAHPVRKATEAQRRLWLLGAEGLSAEARTGEVRFMGNTYYAEWMAEIAGQRLIVRFDPAELLAGLHVYSAENAYLGHAPCRTAAGFFDMAEARAQAKARKAWMKAEKAALEAHRTYRAAELGQMLDAAAPPPADPVEAKVVRASFPKKATPRPAPERDAVEIEAARIAVVEDLARRREAGAAQEEPARERYRRALELERKLGRGDEITAEQSRWLAVYQLQPEYQAERLLWEDFGDAYFG